jgi:predicted nucleic acid-binding Zn ribbon protein
MDCTECGTALPEDATACPECGATVEAPRPPKKRRGGFAVALLLVFVLVATAAAVYVWVLPVVRSRMTGASGARTSASASVEPTSPSSSAERIAVESAVTGFYATANSGDTTSVRSLVTTDTRSAVKKAPFKGWKITTFLVVRSMIDSDTAYVYGRESRHEFGSKAFFGVKFTLRRVQGTWLVQSWQPADKGAVSGALPSVAKATSIALSDATARDLINTLLQARQAGDTVTIRMLTTVRFQKKNAGTWLNGVNNAASFTSFSIQGTKKKRSTYVVTVKERWSGSVRTSTYTVIMKKQTLLVDAHSGK